VYGGMPTLFYDIPHSDPGLFTGIEQCFEPSPAELALVMQQFHLLRKGHNEGILNPEYMKQWEAVVQRRENARTLAEKLDFRVVYPRITEQLHAIRRSWKETGVARYELKEDAAE
jgi:hypothetical protein